MNKRNLAVLFVFAVFVQSMAAFWIRLPGYMDAEYYYGQGVQLFENHSFDENFIWNYLNDPSIIPVAGFSFWLPITSILAALGMFLFGTESFFASRFFFILIAAFIPIIAAKIAFAIQGDKRSAILASGLAIFSGLFFPYATITDTFTPFMVSGGLFFLLAFKILQISSSNPSKWMIPLGILVGLMSLIRSEGILWMVGAGLLILYRIKNQYSTPSGMLKETLFLLSGFFIVVFAWYLRNLQIFGSIFPQGNHLMFWLKGYDDLFVYPNSLLNFKSWLTQGFQQIFLDRIKALWNNLILFVTASGFVVLSPLLFTGFWKLRKNSVLKVSIFLFVFTLVVMSFIFPYAGSRGGFFHSISAFQILACCLVPVGLKNLIDWGVKVRKWEVNRAWLMFSFLSICLAVSISIFSYVTKIRKGIEGTPWNETNQLALTVEKEIRDLTGNTNGIIMVNNPPAYSLYTGRQSVMIPSGGTSAIHSVSDRYDVSFLVLNGERAEIERLMQEDKQIIESFELLMQNGNLKLYEYHP